MNTAVNAAAQLTAVVASFILLPLLVDAFGLSNYGLYVLAASVTGYAALLDFGVGASFIKLVAEHASRGEHDEMGRTFSTALLFYGAVGVIAAAVIAVLAMGAARVFNVTGEEGRLLRNLLMVSSFSALLTWPLNAGGYFLQGLERYTVTARTALFGSLATIAVTVAVIVSGQGPLTLLICQSAVAIGSGIVNLTLARRSLPGVRISPLLAQRAVMKGIITYSWAIFVIQICTIVIYQQTDRLILGVALGASFVALYEGAGKFQTLIVQITGFANSAVLPAASALDARGHTQGLKTLFLRGTKYALMLVLPFVVVLLILAKPLLVAWLGTEFAVAALTAQVFLIHQLFTPSTAVGDNILVGLGKYNKRVPYVVGLLALGNLAIAISLVGKIGMVAVALGTTIPHLLDIVPHMRLILREVGAGFGEFVRQVVLPVYPLLLLPAGIAYAGLRSPLVGGVSGIVAVIAAAVLAFWLGVLAVGLNRTERDELRAAIAGIRSRMVR